MNVNENVFRITNIITKEECDALSIIIRLIRDENATLPKSLWLYEKTLRFRSAHPELIFDPNRVNKISRQVSTELVEFKRKGNKLIVSMYLDWLFDEYPDKISSLIAKIEERHKREQDEQIEKLMLADGTAASETPVGQSSRQEGETPDKSEGSAPEFSQPNKIAARVIDHSFLVAKRFDPSLTPPTSTKPQLDLYDSLKGKLDRFGLQTAAIKIWHPPEFVWKCLLKTADICHWLVPVGPALDLPDPFTRGAPLCLDGEQKTWLVLECEPERCLLFFYDNRYVKAELHPDARNTTRFTLTMWGYVSPTLMSRAIRSTLNRDLEANELAQNRRTVSWAVKTFMHLCDDYQAFGRKIVNYQDPEFYWVASPASGVFRLHPDRNGTVTPLIGQHLTYAEICAFIQSEDEEENTWQVETVEGRVVQELNADGDKVKYGDRLFLINIINDG